MAAQYVVAMWPGLTLERVVTQQRLFEIESDILEPQGKSEETISGDVRAIWHNMSPTGGAPNHGAAYYALTNEFGQLIWTTFINHPSQWPIPVKWVHESRFGMAGILIANFGHRILDEKGEWDWKKIWVDTDRSKIAKAFTELDRGAFLWLAFTALDMASYSLSKNVLETLSESLGQYLPQRASREKLHKIVGRHIIEPDDTVLNDGAMSALLGSVPISIQPLAAFKAWYEALPEARELSWMAFRRGHLGSHLMDRPAVRQKLADLESQGKMPPDLITDVL